MQRSTAQVLNRALAIVARSFPQYITFAHPYVPVGTEQAFQVLHDIAEDQAFMVERIAAAIDSAGYVSSYGEFSMDFTSKHDLRIDYLLSYAIDCQQQDIAQLEALSNQLATAAASRVLIDETLGMAIAHRELLEKSKPELGKFAPTR
jgi:hypothetical protein